MCINKGQKSKFDKTGRFVCLSKLEIFPPSLWIKNILTVLYNIVGNRMGDGKNITAFYHIAVNLWIAAVEYCVVLYLSTLSMIRIVKKNLQGLHLLHN